MCIDLPGWLRSEWKDCGQAPMSTCAPLCTGSHQGQTFFGRDTSSGPFGPSPSSIQAQDCFLDNLTHLHHTGNQATIHLKLHLQWWSPSAVSLPLGHCCLGLFSSGIPSPTRVLRM